MIRWDHLRRALMDWPIYPAVPEVPVSKQTKSSPGDPTRATERRERRLAREAALIEEGRDDIRAGRCINDADVDAWLDGLDGDQELPLPT